MQTIPVDLQSSLSIASSGLNVIEYQYAVTSNNVANSATPGYVSETAVVSSAVSCGYGTGVTQGMTQLNISPALQKELYNQNAIVAQNKALSNSLSAISSVQGSTAAQSGQTNPLPEGRRPKGVTPRLRSGAAAEGARLLWCRTGREDLPKSEVRGGKIGRAHV